MSGIMMVTMAGGGWDRVFTECVVAVMFMLSAVMIVTSGEGGGGGVFCDM